jgi:hypothetical protein
MSLKTVLSIVAAAAVALISTQSFAQDKTRAEVKAEAKEANKKHETPAGEAGPAAAKDGKSTTTRAAVKADAKDANKKHETPAGEAGMAAKDGKSMKARADVKAETKDAAKKKELTPAGEAAAPVKK